MITTCKASRVSRNGGGRQSRGRDRDDGSGGKELK
jgi:hypothetical protein